MARHRVRDERLLKKLKPPRNPEGGWLPPDPKAYEEFWEEVQNEAIRRFGVDEDNDACVIVRLVDNSRQESNVLNFEPIPRNIEDSPYHPYGKDQWNERDTATPEEEETRTRAILENRFWIRRMVQLNFELAQSRLQQLLREDEYALRKEIEKPDHDRKERIKRLEVVKEKYTNPVKYLEDHGYIVDKKEGVYWYAKDDGLDVGPRKKPIPQRPADFDERMEELKRLKAYKPAPEETL